MPALPLLPVRTLLRRAGLFSYERESKQALDALFRHLDAVATRNPAYDLSYANNVIEFKDTASGSTYVINRQPFRKQIWLSSPRSGPYHFDFDPAKRVWVDRRSTGLLELLRSELPE